MEGGFRSTQVNLALTETGDDIAQPRPTQAAVRR